MRNIHQGEQEQDKEYQSMFIKTETAKGKENSLIENKTTKKNNNMGQH